MTSWRRIVTIGDFIADSDGSDFRVTEKLTGWYDAAPVRSGVTDRAQQDGGWDGSGFYGPRPIECQGRVDQASRADALSVAQQLTAMSPRSVLDLTVDDPNLGFRSAQVRVERGAVIEWVSPVGFRYTIQLKAPDPLKYGPQTVAPTTLASSAGGTGRVWPRVWPTDYGLAPGVVAGAVSLANAGTAVYFPQIRLDGGLTNPVVTLTETGDWIRYNATLTTGNWLDIDCGQRRVLFNGQVSHRHLVTFSGSWLAVPVGGGSVAPSADAYTSTHGVTVWGYEGAWS